MEQHFRSTVHVLLWYPCRHQALLPNHSQTSRKSKQNTRRGTQLYRAVTSDGPFLLETPVCAEVGLYLALNMKQAATLGYIQPKKKVLVHCYSNTHKLLLCLEIKGACTARNLPCDNKKKEKKCTHTWTSSISTLPHTHTHANTFILKHNHQPYSRLIPPPAPIKWSRRKQQMKSSCFRRREEERSS